jgi:hypothetical protein
MTVFLIQKLGEGKFDFLNLGLGDGCNSGNCHPDNKINLLTDER